MIIAGSRASTVVLASFMALSPDWKIEGILAGREGRARTKAVGNLSPVPPRLWPEVVDLLHRLWLELCERGPGAPPALGRGKGEVSPVTPNP